jgi:hypothetical protein
MHFCLSLENATRIEGESQVIWTGEGGRAAGLKFVEITPQSRAQIRDWLAALEEPSKEETKQTKPVASASELVERLRREARNVPPRPVAVKQESSVSVAAPEPEQTEPAPPGRPAEYRPESGSVASQILPSASEVPPPPPPVSEPPAPPPAHSPATSSQNPAASHVPVWQKQAPALVPLLALEDETEGGELATARAVRRSLFSRTFRIILLLGLGAGIWFYHEEVGYQLIWLGQQMAGVTQTGASRNTADETSTSATAPSGVSPGPSNVIPKAPAKSAGEAQMKKPQLSPPMSEPAAQEQPSSTTKEEAGTPGEQIAGESSPGPAEAPQDSGQAEYSEAMRILGGNEVGPKLPVAVRLLWASVKKGNSDAEVTLAGLYRDGRGVQKNCEQTRVLLSAAARKGNALAQKSLQQIVRDGCE